jgi:hypothetical protein
LVQSIIRGEVEELISGEEVWGLEEKGGGFEV